MLNWLSLKRHVHGRAASISSARLNLVAIGRSRPHRLALQILVACILCTSLTSKGAGGAPPVDLSDRIQIHVEFLAETTRPLALSRGERWSPALRSPCAINITCLNGSALSYVELQSKRRAELECYDIRSGFQAPFTEYRFVMSLPEGLNLKASERRDGVVWIAAIARAVNALPIIRVGLDHDLFELAPEVADPHALRPPEGGGMSVSLRTSRARQIVGVLPDAFADDLALTLEVVHRQSELSGRRLDSAIEAYERGRVACERCKGKGTVFVKAFSTVVGDRRIDQGTWQQCPSCFGSKVEVPRAIRQRLYDADKAYDSALCSEALIQCALAEMEGLDAQLLPGGRIQRLIAASNERLDAEVERPPRDGSHKGEDAQGQPMQRGGSGLIRAAWHRPDMKNPHIADLAERFVQSEALLVSRDQDLRAKALGPIYVDDIEEITGAVFVRKYVKASTILDGLSEMFLYRCDLESTMARVRSRR